MSENLNNFLVFNENFSPSLTMSDSAYQEDTYRKNGLIPMIADPLAHNKMFRQWSIMAAAVAKLINSGGQDATDESLSELSENLVLAVKFIIAAETQTKADKATKAQANNFAALTEGGNISDSGKKASDFANASHNHDIADINEILATAEEINFLQGAESNIQEQLNALSGVNPGFGFPVRAKNTAYELEDICIAQNFKKNKFLACVESGITSSEPLQDTPVGQYVTDGTVRWLVCDFLDSAAVGTIKNDFLARPGWIKADGATVNRSDYPRLFKFAQDNELLTATPAIYPGLFGEGDGTTTFTLPNLETYFIRLDSSRAVGSSQESANLSHTHSYQDWQSAASLPGTVGTDPALIKSYLDITRTTGMSGGDESRPKNIAYVPVIKY